MLTNVVLAFLCVGFIALAILSAVGFHEEREELTRLDERNDELARRLDTLTEKLHDATRATGTGRHAMATPSSSPTRRPSPPPTRA